MKLKATLFILFFTIVSSFAQDYFPNKETFNGNYYGLTPIVLRNGSKVDFMICQVGDMGNDKVLAMAACKSCMPAVYTFKPESSKEIKKAVFYNKWGIMIIQYDKESFVRLIPTQNKPRIEFFSKNKSTISSLTEQKVIEYAMKYAEQL